MVLGSFGSAQEPNSAAVVFVICDVLAPVGFRPLVGENGVVLDRWVMKWPGAAV
ncbi:MAG: hypothetical protein ACTHPS_19615 [Streptosporangiaceae bacterium]